MFSLDEMAIRQRIQVNVTDLSVQDARTGKVQKMTFYRAGKRFPFEAVSKELAEYGYRILSMGETSYEDGSYDMSDLFGALIQQGEQK